MERNYNLVAGVEKIIADCDDRMLALVRQSTQELVDQVQLPFAKGGKMRIDTGFLRASGQLSLVGMPSGPIRGDSNLPGSFQYNETAAITALAGYKLGNTIYFGWSANYAKYREAYDGFLYSGVQNFQQIVNKVSAEIKARF